MPTRLKSLELQGYKTFASRSLLEFAGNITAIVGPNGSGKSNVADAMRWVLGEQSYSLLRARKTEDMIFSGSERRPRAGMASATVLFDNADHWLPIDYTEVSITRRAYRDGQNEYLLNGQKVRLKEINELLGQSGLAERTYTVIGQGLVDAALSLRPEERRRFFEEAAGIQLFRRRRDEAMGRMDTTRRNMDRVLDILSEIKPRLRSLERQAARVEEYDRISADLRLLLRDWYGYHWHKTQRDIQHAQEVFRVREEAAVKAREHLLMTDGKISQLRTKLQALRDQLNLWHAESSELHQQREQASKQLAVFDERQRALQEQRNEFDINHSRIQEEILSLQSRQQTYAEERNQLQQEVEEATAQLSSATTQLKERLAERAVMENQIRNQRREITQLETEQLKISAGKTELENRIRHLSESLQAQEEQVLQEQNAVEKSKKVLADLTQDLTDAEQNVSEQTQLWEEMQEKIRTHRQELDHSKQLRDAYAVEISKVQAQLKLLQDAERSFSGLTQGSKLLLQNSQSGSLKGKYQALNSLLDIPREYETAAAAVLGETLDAVVLDADSDILEALRLLESKDTGRTILVPSADTFKNRDLTRSLPASCRGVLLDLMIVPVNLKGVFAGLFGNAYVMESRQAAMDFVGQLPENTCAVTLDGEIFRSDGVVIFGREGAKNTVIGRPRQIRELQGKLKQLEKEVAANDQALMHQDSQIQLFLTTEQQLHQQLRNLQAERNSVEKSQRQVQLENHQAEERLKFQANQCNKTASQLEQAQVEIRTCTQQIKETENRLADQRNAVRDQQRTLNELPVMDLQQEESHWRTNLAVANRALQDAEQRVNDYERSIQTAQERMTSLQRRMAEHAGDVATLQQEQDILMRDEGVLNADITELNQKILPAEEELNGLEKNYNQLQDELSIAQQTSSATERNETQAQIELSRQRDALETLREKIQEDFGLVAFQYEGEVSGQETLPFGDMVEQLPRIIELPQGLNDEIRRNRAQLRRLGAINLDAKHEFDEVFERHEFLTQQLDDLKKADENLTEVIRELNDLMRLEFRKTFDAVAAEFKELFTRLFGGGTARLEMTDDENPTEAGIEIHAKLPGRREQGLALLSGGERSLTAVALVFSLLKVSPTPFCILDEVDAMLDESNVGRFCDLLKELGDMGTQFIVITHNRGTVQASDVIYGVTKGNDSSSQLISLKLDEVSEDMAQ